eukprot:6174432-Pleurochrysis_carterae.AAC.1
MLARLKVPEPPQHGVSTGGPRPKRRQAGQGPAVQTRSASRVPLGGDRASRFHTPAFQSSGRKRHNTLTKDQQASFLQRYYGLPTKRSLRVPAQRSLCEEFNVIIQHGRRLVQRLQKSAQLFSHHGKKGRPKEISAANVKLVNETLRKH